MKIFFSSLLSLFFYHGLFAQDIIINGKTGNRPLTWDDFTGQPDPQNPFIANTWWNLNYRFSGMSFKADTVYLKGLTITLELNPARSWVRKGGQTPELLRHEQGHFDIGRLCAMALKKTMDTAVFLTGNYKTKHAELFNAVMKEYHEMGLLYDKETDHSKNKAEQSRWEALIAAKLAAY